MNASQQLSPYSRPTWLEYITAQFLQYGVRHFVEACDARSVVIAHQAVRQNQTGEKQS